jgi:hypothetical protein
MFRVGCGLIVALAAAYGQYKLEPAGALPAAVPSGFAALLDSKGHKITGPDGLAYELWFRKEFPAGAKSPESAVSFPTIPHGAVLGVIQFVGKGSDRRGQTLKPGVYTMRYSLYPVDGNHQGVAPQRDFLILIPVESDKDLSSTPTYEVLMELSKTAGTLHPAVLSIGQPVATAFPSFEKEGENDWTLNVKAGGLTIAVILVGSAT